MSAANSHFERISGRYTISTDPARLDPVSIHATIAEAYWAPGRTYDAVVRSLRHSLCFGLYDDDEQVGLARVVTDFTVFAYLCDVYILDEHRGQGLGKWLIASALAHPELQTVRRWTLSTRDADEFYAVHGFTSLRNPASQMELMRTPP